MTRRPKLGAVFAGDPTATRPAPTPSPTPASESIPPAPVEKTVQLNVAVPESLRRAVKIKALQRGQDMNTVIRELLTVWVNDLDT